MSDNVRTALYDADYSCTLASRRSDAVPRLARVVGKHCESGDIVVMDEYLPDDISAGDLIAVPGTGAYCRSLSSQYNHTPARRWWRSGTVRPGSSCARDGGRPARPRRRLTPTCDPHLRPNLRPHPRPLRPPRIHPTELTTCRAIPRPAANCSACRQFGRKDARSVGPDRGTMSVHGVGTARWHSPRRPYRAQGAHGE